MLELNQQHMKRLLNYSIITIPKSLNYSDYKFVVPNRFITKSGFQRFINLPDNQKIKIKKDDKSLYVTIEDLKIRK